MKSIKGRFNRTASKNPQWSSYLCFYGAVENQRFKRRTINRWFYKLVDEDDYFIEDGITELLHFLYKSSNPDK